MGHRQAQLTTGLHTLGVADELDGNFDDNGLFVVDLEEVDVEDVVLYGVELDVLEDGHLLVAVEFDLDSEDFGAVYEFANGVVGDDDVGGDETLAVFDLNDLLALFELAGVGEFNDFATADYCGDLVVGAESLCGLLAEVDAGSGGQLVSFHCKMRVKWLCY